MTTPSTSASGNKQEPQSPGSNGPVHDHAQVRAHKTAMPAPTSVAERDDLYDDIPCTD